MSYAKSYLNISKLADTIVQSTVTAGPKGYTRRKGLAAKNPAVSKVVSDNDEFKAILNLNPTLATQLGIKKATQSSPVRVAQMDTALIDGVRTPYDMTKFKVNEDGTALVPLTSDEKISKDTELSTATDTDALTVIKEYDTEISKKLLADLKTSFPDLSQKQLSAILGNLHHESRGFTRYQQVMGEGVSYAQWSGERKKQFLKFAKDNNLDPKGYDAGFKFLVYELNNNRKHGFLNQEFKNAFDNPDASLSELTEIFENNYLAAGRKRMPDRIKDAEMYIMEYE